MNHDENVRAKRGILTDAMHAMHFDQRIKVDLELAKALSQAWDEYDKAITQTCGVINEAWIHPWLRSWVRRDPDGHVRCVAGPNGSGYPHIWHEGKDWAAHILQFKHQYGDVPSGQEIDHGCDDRSCILHLQALTHGDNVRRSLISQAGRNSRKTMCEHGHPLSGRNLRIYRSPQGDKRICRACKAATTRGMRQRGGEEYKKVARQRQRDWRARQRVQRDT